MKFVSETIIDQIIEELENASDEQYEARMEAFSEAQPVVVAWLFGLVAAGWLGVWKFLTFGETLEITNKRSILHVGILRKNTTEVLHDNIRNVQVDQSFWNRVWKVGTMGISSSAQAGVEIEAKHIPKPHHVRKVIDLYRPID